MKDIKHIKWDFHSITWFMPGGPRGSIFFFSEHGHVAYQIDRDDEQNRMQVQFSP